MVLTNNDKTNRPSGRFLNDTCLNYSPIYDKISVQRKGTKMAKINDFKDALELMQDGRGYFVNSSDFSVAGNMDKWLCVHATNYMPRRDRNGNVYIPTTGMATGYKYARATVHFTLNQIVSSHMGGNWDASPIVVLAPYNDIVAKNGNPRMVASEDTFFIPNPDTGLILPETTHIIRPDNGRLFNIGEHVSTYKTDKFTDQEIETILSLVPLSSRQEYEKYANAELTEYEMENLLRDEYVRRVYNAAQDKRMFIRGLLEESRMVILTNFLREAVVRMAMDKMGYQYVYAHENEFSNTVANNAVAHGISATGDNKGHSGTLEREFEQIGLRYLDLIHLCNTGDIGEIYDACVHKYISPQFIMGDSMVDVYQSYVDDLDKYIKMIRNNVYLAREFNNKYPNDVSGTLESQLQKDLDFADMLERGGIRAYNPYLDITLRRNSARLNQECAKAIEKLKQNPEYSLLRKMLTDLVKNGKMWYKTPGGWEPEIDLDWSITPDLMRQNMGRI